MECTFSGKDPRGSRDLGRLNHADDRHIGFRYTIGKADEDEMY
jgi:hypothetical protein